MSAVSRRRKAPGVLAARAAERALKNANVSAEKVDFILLATSSPDHCFPNGACEVQAAIGAVHAMAFGYQRGMFRI